MNIPFNMNDYVRVKLTDKGREIHKKTWTSLVPRMKYNPPKEDKDGWSEWQLWVLMQEFGAHIAMGIESPLESNIEIIIK